MGEAQLDLNSSIQSSNFNNVISFSIKSSSVGDYLYGALFIA